MSSRRKRKRKRKTIGKRGNNIEEKKEEIEEKDEIKICNEKEGEQIFRSKSEQYFCAFEDRKDDSKLDGSVVDPEGEKKLPFHTNIRVRMPNGVIYIQNAEYYINWFLFQTGRIPTDPVSGEPIEYLRKRLIEKRKFIRLFPDIIFAEVESEDFKADLFARFLDNKSEDVERLRSFLDISLLEKSGLVYRNIDMETTEHLLKDKSYGTCLIRKSGSHQKIVDKIKNCDVFCLAIRSLNKIRQYRIINIHGIGFYNWCWFKNEARANLESQSMEYLIAGSNSNIMDLIESEGLNAHDTNLYDVLASYLSDDGRIRFNPRNILSCQ
jgi:hypothetical protein